MRGLSFLTLVFAIAFLVFFFAPPLLGKLAGPCPLMRIGDLFDIFTPLVLLPLYWLLCHTGQKRPLGVLGTIVFLILAAFWVEGQGMHLSANSISHLLKGMESSDVFRLANFYDEVLSHYLWHFGVVGLSALLIARQWRNPIRAGGALPWVIALAGVIHGSTFFAIVIEGATPPLGVPFAVLAVLFALVWGRKKLGQQPLLLFFLITYLVSTLLFAGWWIYWGSFLQFSQIGWID